MHALIEIRKAPSQSNAYENIFIKKFTSKGERERETSSETASVHDDYQIE